MYGRFFLSIRDIRSLFCQIILPALFALVGLAVIKLVLDENNPKIEMSINQWYSSNDYQIPMGMASNIDNNSLDINNKFRINNNYMNFFNEELKSLYGTMTSYKYIESLKINSTTNIEKTLNSTRNVLYLQRLDNNINQYNAFWAPEILGTGTGTSIYSIINVSAVHSLPISYNILNNWILRYKLQNISSSISTIPSINFYAYPFPDTQTEIQTNNQFSGVLVSLFLMIALTFIPIGAAYNIVNDRINLTKHQQLVSGISCVSYWFANYIADFLLSLPACLLIWIFLHIFDTQTFLGDVQGTFILILLFFSLSILPFTYLLSNIFSSSDKVQVGIGAAYIILGLFLLITSYLLDSLDDSIFPQSAKNFFNGLYKIFPTFLMADSLLNLARFGFLLNPLDWDITGENLIIMISEAIGYFIIVLIVEYGLVYKTSISKWWFNNKKHSDNI